VTDDAKQSVVRVTSYVHLGEQREIVGDRRREAERRQGDKLRGWHEFDNVNGSVAGTCQRQERIRSVNDRCDLAGTGKVMQADAGRNVRRANEGLVGRRVQDRLVAEDDALQSQEAQLVVLREPWRQIPLHHLKSLAQGRARGSDGLPAHVVIDIGVAERELVCERGLDVRDAGDLEE